MIKKFILQILGVLIICFTSCWAYTKPGFDSIIAFLVAIFTYLGWEYQGEYHQPNNSDKELYNRFIKGLPTQGVIEYITDTDMARPIDTRILNELLSFNNTWKAIEYEFKDKKIEKAKKKLLTNIDSFFTEFSIKTYPTHNSGFNAIPIEWSEDNPQKYNQVRDSLNKLADQVVNQHTMFVKTARKRLKI